MLYSGELLRALRCEGSKASRLSEQLNPKVGWCDLVPLSLTWLLHAYFVLLIGLLLEVLQGVLLAS